MNKIELKLLQQCIQMISSSIEERKKFLYAPMIFLKNQLARLDEIQSSNKKKKEPKINYSLLIKLLKQAIEENDFALKEEKIIKDLLIKQNNAAISI